MFWLKDFLIEVGNVAERVAMIAGKQECVGGFFLLDVNARL